VQLENRELSWVWQRETLILWELKEFDTNPCYRIAEPALFARSARIHVRIDLCLLDSMQKLGLGLMEPFTPKFLLESLNNSDSFTDIAKFNLDISS
jgi:hypothetical protein